MHGAVAASKPCVRKLIDLVKKEAEQGKDLAPLHGFCMLLGGMSLGSSMVMAFAWIMENNHGPSRMDSEMTSFLGAVFIILTVICSYLGALIAGFLVRTLITEWWKRLHSCHLLSVLNGICFAAAVFVLIIVLIIAKHWSQRHRFFDG